MLIYKIEPGKEPALKNIDNTLEALQAEVDGPIETVSLDNGMVVIVNEEGRLRGMEPCCWMKAGCIREMLVGPVVIARCSIDSFDSVRESDPEVIRRDFHMVRDYD